MIRRRTSLSAVPVLSTRSFFRASTILLRKLLAGERSGKYSPIEVAQWLEDLAAIAIAKPPKDRRMEIDVAIQAGLGKFYAAKFRAGVLYAIHQRANSRDALEEAVKLYHAARAAWAGLADRAKGVYVADVSVGELPWLRGHWLDRLPAIDADIALLEKRLAAIPIAPAGGLQLVIMLALSEATGRPTRPSLAVGHSPVERFERGKPLDLALDAPPLHSARLYYRRVNQAERWQSAAMERKGASYTAAIPGAYTASPYPLQYYFELKSAPNRACLHPGFPADLAGQPYYVVRGNA